MLEKYKVGSVVPCKVNKVNPRTRPTLDILKKGKDSFSFIYLFIGLFTFVMLVQAVSTYRGKSSRRLDPISISLIFAGFGVLVMCFAYSMTTKSSESASWKAVPCVIVDSFTMMNYGNKSADYETPEIRSLYALGQC